MEILIRLKGYMRYIKAVGEGTDLEVMLNFTTLHVMIVPKRRSKQCFSSFGANLRSTLRALQLARTFCSILPHSKVRAMLILTNETGRVAFS